MKWNFLDLKDDSSSSHEQSPEKDEMSTPAETAKLRHQKLASTSQETTRGRSRFRSTGKNSGPGEFTFDYWSLKMCMRHAQSITYFIFRPSGLPKVMRGLKSVRHGDRCRWTGNNSDWQRERKWPTTSKTTRSIGIPGGNEHHGQKSQTRSTYESHRGLDM